MRGEDLVRRWDFVCTDILKCIEDGVHGPYEVELDDGAPEDTLFAERRWCVEPLEFCN